MTEGYDIIGDIHGHADVLEAMLARLGYRERRGAYRHPGRQAVFVGDLIDRGPRQVRVLEIVRAMVEAGTAQMTLGNHEFNAVAWVTPAEDGDDFCRPHTAKNRRQHESFLQQVGEGSAAHTEWIEWFRAQPMWLDLGGVRVVHACWDPTSMRVLGGPMLTHHHVTATKGSADFEAIEVVLKGPEIPLAGSCYLDKEGNERRLARFRWWDERATTVVSGAEIPPRSPGCDGGEFGPLPDEPLPTDLPRVPAGTPVLYGHYWRSGFPVIDGPRSVCLDWSVAKDGPLVAYRWSGEEDLANANLVAVPH